MNVPLRLMSEPKIIPAEAIIVTTRYDAEPVPTAADMKLLASLLTPAHKPMIANNITIPTITGKSVSIL